MTETSAERFVSVPVHEPPVVQQTDAMVDTEFDALIVSQPQGRRGFDSPLEIRGFQTAEEVWGPPRRAEGDSVLQAMAEWHPACLLSEYKNYLSEEYRRDRQQYGVYVIFELTPNGYEPRFIEALPRYVGRSNILSTRLKQHATGRSSTPANRVMEDYLLNCSRAERKGYNNASREKQQRLREEAMSRRRLWVRTAHTQDQEQSDLLEKAMVRLYESQDIQLWNHIKFKTTAPFRHKG